MWERLVDGCRAPGTSRWAAETLAAAALGVWAGTALMAVYVALCLAGVL